MLTKDDFVKKMMEMNPKDFPSRAAAMRSYESVWKILGDELKAGEAYNVSGFGTFKPVHKEARVARNVATGEPVNVPEKNVAKFYASAKLNNSLNDSN